MSPTGILCFFLLCTFQYATSASVQVGAGGNKGAGIGGSFDALVDAKVAFDNSLIKGAADLGKKVGGGVTDGLVNFNNKAGSAIKTGVSNGGKLAAAATADVSSLFGKIGSVTSGLLKSSLNKASALATEGKKEAGQLLTSTQHQVDNVVGATDKLVGGIAAKLEGGAGAGAGAGTGAGAGAAGAGAGAAGAGAGAAGGAGGAGFAISL